MFRFWYHKENPVNKFTAVLAVAVLLLSLAGAAVLLRPAIQAVAEIIKNRPEKYRLIALMPDDCKNCFDIYQVTDFLKTAKEIKYSSVKEYKASSKNAELLIKTYKINVLPTFVLQGDIKKLGLAEFFDQANIGFIDDKNFVYANFFPPFYNLGEKRIRGEFGIIYLSDKSCTECYDAALHDLALKNLVMIPTASSTVDVGSDDGKKMIGDYKIQYIPTIILRGDMDAYQNFGNLWETVGTIEKDGAYVFREEGLKVMGAYKNLKTGALVSPK